MTWLWAYKVCHMLFNHLPGSGLWDTREVQPHYSCHLCIHWTPLGGGLLAPGHPLGLIACQQPPASAGSKPQPSGSLGPAWAILTSHARSGWDPTKHPAIMSQVTGRERLQPLEGWPGEENVQHKPLRKKAPACLRTGINLEEQKKKKRNIWRKWKMFFIFIVPPFFNPPYSHIWRVDPLSSFVGIK